MINTDHAPLPLEQDQHVHYIAPDGTPCEGRVLGMVTPHRLTKGKQDTYHVERTKDRRIVDVKANWIQRKED